MQVPREAHSEVRAQKGPEALGLRIWELRHGFGAPLPDMELLSQHVFCCWQLAGAQM
jgi:hypothetical protein